MSLRAEVDALVKAAGLEGENVQVIRVKEYRDVVEFVTSGGVVRHPIGKKAPAKKAAAKKAPAKKAAAKKAPAKKAAAKK